jgi:lipopolysaccharide cholinephosphotransferase
MEVTADLQPRWNAIIIDIFREFIKICKENGLTYYCIYGTAIGAIRHNGIIPWDDDIDVNMPRPDFDRFVDICSRKDMGDYELVSPQNTPNYPYNCYKFCRKNTTILEHIDIPYVIGLFIDIFPLDGTADDVNEAYALMQQYKKINGRLVAISTHNSFIDYLSLLLTPKHWGRFIYKTIGFFFRERYKKYLLRKMDIISRSHNFDNSINVIQYNGVYGYRDIFPKLWFQGSTSFLFEGMIVDLPIGYDDYLRQIYNDYMQLPPEDHRTSHHYKIYFNMNKRVSLSNIKFDL